MGLRGFYSFFVLNRKSVYKIYLWVSTQISIKANGSFMLFFFPPCFQVCHHNRLWVKTQWDPELLWQGGNRKLTRFVLWVILWLAASWTERVTGKGENLQAPLAPNPDLLHQCAKNKGRNKQTLLCLSYNSPLQQSMLLWLFWLNSQF